MHNVLSYDGTTVFPLKSVHINLQVEVACRSYISCLWSYDTRKSRDVKDDDDEYVGGGRRWGTQTIQFVQQSMLVKPKCHYQVILVPHPSPIVLRCAFGTPFMVPGQKIAFPSDGMESHLIIRMSRFVIDSYPAVHNVQIKSEMA